MAKYISYSLLHAVIDIHNEPYSNIKTSRKSFTKEIFLIQVFPNYSLPPSFLNFINVLQKQFYETQMLKHC